jgi:fatty-acyl-CoA synthase
VHETQAATAAADAARLLGRPLLLIEAASPGYAAALAAPAPPRREPRADDTLLWYTGGTTGRPRGVVWEVDTHYRLLWEVIKPDSDPPDPADLATRRWSAPTALPASPLAHGTAMGLALNTLNGGGTVVLHEQASFDPSAALELVDRYAVRVLGIVGDAYARPLLAELDTGRWKDRLRSLAAVSSSGAVWSPEVRARLAGHLPGAQLIDNFGSTEAVVSRDKAGKGFQSREGLLVIGPDDQPVQPGSGQVGVIAASGRLPLGYLNDPVKTAEAFRVINGVRYFIGDQATVNADGSIRMLGRGDSCINTGGEKVWPEEVEIVVRDHPAVADAAIIGLPDEKWGQRVTAVAALRPGVAVTDEELGRHCRARLTPYKCPKQWVRVPSVPRTYVGKPDYAAVRALANRRTAMVSPYDRTTL